MKENVINNIKNARRGFALTGAGISAPSGIPTFRGEDGFWRNKDPYELASPSGFKKDPQLVWDWYNERRFNIREAGPNPAHYAIKEIGDSFEKFVIITQNVDNLHQQAGSKDVLELHGNIFGNKCNLCGKIFNNVESKEVPHCDVCDGLIRPDVIWFGEALSSDVLKEAWRWTENSDICLVIGTSAVVQPASYLPILARENGAFIMEINKSRTVISPYVDESIIGDVSIILPELARLRLSSL
ncbi:NAD-dependent deacylase [candidate division WOR-3 bacterium]|nr:NAD-dependent deacylase [candidate division WOR-3 bacterium]